MSFLQFDRCNKLCIKSVPRQGRINSFPEPAIFLQEGVGGSGIIHNRKPRIWALLDLRMYEKQPQTAEPNQRTFYHSCLRFKRRSVPLKRANETCQFNSFYCETKKPV